MHLLKPPPPPDDYGGRPASLNFRGKLGLFLLWYSSSRMKLKELCPIFDCVPTSAHKYFKKLLQLAATNLRRNPEAQIKFPNEAEPARHSLLIWCSVA